MSILIKNVPMPKNESLLIIISEDGSITYKRHDEKKWHDGTAIELPPHGDLIDRDALMKKLNNCMFPSDMVTTIAVSMAMNWLKESPTIIESEGET